MAVIRDYKCHLCGTKLNIKDIVRIKKELYHINRYKQFSTDMYTDFCKKCYIENIAKLIGDVKYENRK